MLTPTNPPNDPLFLLDTGWVVSTHVGGADTDHIVTDLPEVSEFCYLMMNVHTTSNSVDAENVRAYAERNGSSFFGDDHYYGFNLSDRTSLSDVTSNHLDNNVLYTSVASNVGTILPSGQKATAAISPADNGSGNKAFFRTLAALSANVDFAFRIRLITHEKASQFSNGVLP